MTGTGTARKKLPDPTRDNAASTPDDRDGDGYNNVEETRAGSDPDYPTSTPASDTRTVDITAPETTITASPLEFSSDDMPSFGFSSDEGGSTFECQLDGAGFSPCTSPASYPGGVSDGFHTFEVRATDSLGNTDATPASYTWTIDTAAPDTTITASPADP